MPLLNDHFSEFNENKQNKTPDHSILKQISNEDLHSPTACIRGGRERQRSGRGSKDERHSCSRAVHNNHPSGTHFYFTVNLK